MLTSPMAMIFKSLSMTTVDSRATTPLGDFADDVVGSVSVGQNVTPVGRKAFPDFANESALVVDESFDVSYDQADLHTGELITRDRKSLFRT